MIPFWSPPPPPPPPPPPFPQKLLLSSSPQRTYYPSLLHAKVAHPRYYTYIFDLHGYAPHENVSVQIFDNDALLEVRFSRPCARSGADIEHIERYRIDEDCDIDGVSAWTQEDVLLVKLPRTTRRTI